MKKPEPIRIDNELFQIEDERDIEPICLYVSGPRMGLSPYETEELRDWLTEVLKWFEYEHSQGR